MFNGGAWLEVDGRHIDVHYRDLNDVEHQLTEAEQGRFHVEHLAFHLAGIPSYLVVAELATKRTLRGQLPTPDYPEALRGSAPEVWWSMAQLTLGYVREAHAERGHLAETVGAIGQATCDRARGVGPPRRVDHQREAAHRPRRPARGRAGAGRCAAGRGVVDPGRRQRPGAARHPRRRTGDRSPALTGTGYWPEPGADRDAALTGAGVARDSVPTGAGADRGSVLTAGPDVAGSPALMGAGVDRTRALPAARR